MRESSLNGKTGEWIRYLGGLVLAAVIAYFTAMSTINQAIAEVRTTEDAHFSEVLRRLDIMQTDIRELRNRP